MDIITRAVDSDFGNLYGRAWQLKCWGFIKRQRHGEVYWVKPADQVSPQQLLTIQSWDPWQIWKQSWSDKSLPLLKRNSCIV